MPGCRRGSRRSDVGRRRPPRTGTPVGAAAGGELVAEAGVVERRGDEEAARVLDAVGRDPAQDAVLLDALRRGRRILDGVAPAGVEQAVEAAGRAVGEVAALDEDRP